MSTEEAESGRQNGADPSSSNSHKEHMSDSGKTCVDVPEARPEETHNGAQGNEGTTDPQDGGKVVQGDYKPESEDEDVSEKDSLISVRRGNPDERL